jgi:hypothetical protein
MIVTDEMIEAGCNAHYKWFSSWSTSEEQRVVARAEVLRILTAALSLAPQVKETPAPVPHVAGIEEGIERAARYIEKQRDEYVQEYGMYDGTTGVTEFSNGGEEYLSTLEELIDGIRALATTEGTQ